MPDIPLISKPRAQMDGVPSADPPGQGYGPTPTLGLNRNPLLDAILGAGTISSPWQGIVPLDRGGGR